MRCCSQSGYTLAELSIACGVATLLIVMGIPILTNATMQTGADSAATLIAQQLSYARALAIGNHLSVMIQFTASNSVVVAPGTGDPRGPFPLGSGMQLLASAIAPNTPDNLNSSVLGTGSNTQMSFLDNGSAVDSPATNNIVSGTFFLQHINGNPATRRAVTLTGGTGRVHVWRYDTQNHIWR